MNKLCCCTDPELPNLTFKVTCVCCQSKVDDRRGKDSPDFNADEIDGNEEQASCCFPLRRKCHAKVEGKKKTVSSSDGQDT